MSEENIENITKSDSNFASTIVDHHVLSDINFNGHSLINNICISKKVRNIYMNKSFKLNNCLFGSVKLTENADPDK